ncbi:hypothetical protein B7P43_G05622 [Cryptotermes secundus]|uniref:Uncharacterized protein n=2 Tax=Cryptotermes secundus TaxID=105785 RepID=A0A2J7Q4R0_9NEOP|nr:hypothetical protein B7P43_G05622 [Cryptotermes secundus]
MECVAGFWKSRVEESEQTPWPATSFISATHEDEQRQKEQNGETEYPKMASVLPSPPAFTRGSHRRYMNHLIRSNSSEKLDVNSHVKSEDASLTEGSFVEAGDNICSTNRNTATAGRTTNDHSSKFHKVDSLAEKQSVTTVPGVDNKNYVVSNRNVNSRAGRLKSLVSLCSRTASDMRGPMLPSTNGVEADGGVVVDNEGDAPSSSSFLSFTHPLSLRDITCQCDVEAEESPSTGEKCNTKKGTKGRQRKTGAITGGWTQSAGAVQDIAAHAPAVLRFPCVEKLIHKYTVMIAEQRTRALAEKQVENQSRRKQKQGNIENHSSNQSQEFSSNSAKQQKHNSELAKPSTKHSHEKAIRGQVTTESSDFCQCSQEHVQFIIDRVGDSTRQIDDREVFAEHSTKYVQQYHGETMDSSAGLQEQRGNKNTTKLHTQLPLQCECDNGKIEHTTSHLRHSHTQNYVSGSQEQGEYHGNHSRDWMELRGQCHVRNRLTDHDPKMHSQPEINDDCINVTQSQHWNDAAGQEASHLRQVCQENNKEETDILQQATESLTSLFIKPSSDVTPNVSHVGGSAASARGEEGRHSLMLPRASKRSVSPGSDEGCSVALPPECSLTPCSSEDDIVKRLVEKSTARWTWPPVNNDQDTELQGPGRRQEYGRYGSSDSAVCLLPSDDERKLQMKDPGISLHQTSTDYSNITEFVTSEEKSSDKAMVFDRYVDKASDVSFDLVNLQYIWRHGPSSKESDIFPDEVSRRNSGDNDDAWFEEIRDNAKEAACDDICDSGIDRDTFLLGSTGESCWDFGSVEGKTDLVDSRYQIDTSPASDGYSCSYRQKQIRKLRSMISCESGVVEDEDCSRKSSTAEDVENDDGYLVELRRQSAQSFQTDDDESSATSQYRQWRTPSVVVSDYSDDVPYFTSVTLEELEQLEDASASECASGASSVSGSVGVSALDTEYALRTPERKASDCSTCSTLSGDEDASCDALLQPVRTRQKVGHQVHLLSLYFVVPPTILMWQL